MSTPAPFGSPAFQLVAKDLIALHRLIRDGNEDSPEAESIRDALDPLLQGLNRIEKERAQWLSEDLYSISEPASASSQKEMNPQAQQQLTEAIEARHVRQWDRALTLLRRWRDHISPALLSYLRGSIWLEAGNFNVATVFFGHAMEIDPENASYRVSYMSTLAKSDPESAKQLAKEVSDHDQAYAPVVVAQAALILFSSARIASDAESSQRYGDLIPILQRTLSRIEADQEATSRLSAYALTASLLGYCHQFLGNTGAAVNWFSRGLRLNPNDDALLVARGILLYGQNSGAVADFEQAIQVGSPEVWPYLFLAHHYLDTKRFEKCREMCETGLRMRGSDTAKSQLQDWLAIAKAQLGFPPESIRAAFEAALRLDPTNDRAKRNRDYFEESIGIAHTISASRWDQGTESSVRQFGLAERRADHQYASPERTAA